MSSKDKESEELLKEDEIDFQMEQAAEKHAKELSEGKMIKRNETSGSTSQTSTSKKKKVSSSVKVKVSKHPQAELPKYQTPGSAGLDACANITFQKVIKPGESALIPTGIKTIIPEGYEIQVRPRSGLALNKSISILNSPGTIDSDFRSELGVILINHGTEQFIVNRNDRIAQFVLSKVEKLEWDEVTEEDFQKYVEDEQNKRQGGFGSTGQ